MNTALTIASIVVVLVGAAVAAFVLFELSPFARHSDVYHGTEHQHSPRLD